MPTEKSVVTDATGRVYPYEEWNDLFHTGKYKLVSRTGPKGNTSPYILSRMTDAEIKQNMLLAASKKSKADTIWLNAPEATATKAGAQQPVPITETLKPLRETEFFITGEEFKPFKERDMDGNVFDIKKLRGKVIVLNFWFIGCPPCREEIPDLNALADSYKTNDDVVFIAIALDEKYDIKKFLKLHPYNYHIIDDGQLIADKYGIKLYPTNVIIDKEGKVQYHTYFSGPDNIKWMKKIIEQYKK